MKQQLSASSSVQNDHEIAIALNERMKAEDEDETRRKQKRVRLDAQYAAGSAMQFTKRR
jgi:hypothetical protein